MFRTHPGAPRVLIANSLLVPAWATFENFRDLEDRGLTMYGQMTAGSWIYIGTQGILQGTYETLAELARQRFNGTLAGRVFVSAGLGGMGGAQPLAATMNGGAALVVEVDPHRIDRRLATRYVDEATDNLDAALAAVTRWQRDGTARSIALCANAADVLPALVARGFVPDVLTDQSSAHDAMLDLKQRGAITFDYGNNIRAQAVKGGVTNAFDIPGFVPEYIRPLFCEGKGPFRWAALSGDAADIAATDAAALEMFADNEALCRWIKLAGERVAFQGLPARIFWLGYGERARFGLKINELVRGGLAQPGNRGHAGRQRRDCRLAGAERVTQHGGRGDVGVGAPWRRRRHRLLAARRHGHRRGRHPRGRRAARASPHV